jgi:aspartate kinase
MALIVQKYGGTSVGNTDRIKNVAARVAQYREKGDKIVVVVSAMSGVTDNLIKLAREIMPLPDEREMDVLLATGEQTTIALTAIALHSVGVPAVSMTGAQAGIMTDGVHTKAKIQNITPKKVHDLLNQGKVVIVAGFQGETPEGQVTTLGRGGHRARRSVESRSLPDLHRRGWRLYGRPPDCDQRAEAGRNFLR